MSVSVSHLFTEPKNSCLWILGGGARDRADERFSVLIDMTLNEYIWAICTILYCSYLPVAVPGSRNKPTTLPLLSWPAYFNPLRHTHLNKTLPLQKPHAPLCTKPSHCNPSLCNLSQQIPFAAFEVSCSKSVLLCVKDPQTGVVGQQQDNPPTYVTCCRLLSRCGPLDPAVAIHLGRLLWKHLGVTSWGQRGEMGWEKAVLTVS